MNTTLGILTATVNSLWQAVAVAALVWVALRLWLGINAATRYAVWWAALMVILILPVAPRWIAMVLPHAPTSSMNPTETSSSFSATPARFGPVIVTVTPGRAARWPIVVIAIWASILLWRFYQIGLSYIYLRGVKQRSTVATVAFPLITRRADLLISADIVSPMAVGFLRPAVVLPESLLEELSEAEREYVVLHEAAHLARQDDWANLAMRLLGGLLALHPVAIWILRRIDREREIACDDWVVARTGEARPYAVSLARLFELCSARREQLLAAGIFGSGSRVGDRIEMLVRRGRAFSTKMSGTGFAAAAAVLCGLVLAGSLVPRWIAFAQQEPRPSFEVASVKPTPVARSGNDYGTNFRSLPGGGFSAENVSLRVLIMKAYSVDSSQIAGGKWLGLGGDRYDIEARADNQDIRFRAAVAAGPAARQALQDSMLQSLLADRFKLAVHRETKDTSGYALVVAKGGFKLKETPEARSGDGSISVLGKGQLKGQKAPLAMLVAQLTRLVGRPVVDDTGLEGGYDFNLEWTPEDTPADLATAPSIFTAIQEQLGLRLDSRKEQTEIIVVDHVEKPDLN